MKKITIPERYGYPTVDVTINFNKYTLNTGVEIEVEDAVAEAIEHIFAMQPREDPNGGQGIAATLKDVVNQSYFRGYHLTNADIMGLVGTPNDYAYSKESGTVWRYQSETGWFNSGETALVLAETKAIKEQVDMHSLALATSGLTYTQEIEQEYESRVTANGEAFMDGSKAILKKVEGSTVVYDKDENGLNGKLANASFAGIESVGRNLIPFPYEDYPQGAGVKDFYGVKFTIGEDGTMTLNGTYNASTIIDFVIRRNMSIPAGTYTLSGAPEGGDVYTHKLLLIVNSADGKVFYYVDTGGSITFNILEGDLLTLYVRLGQDLGTVSNLVYKPMLNYGSTALPYEPYIKNTFNFPRTEVPLGRTIDFETKKITDYGVDIVLTGEEAWNITDGKYFYAKKYPPASQQDIGACNAFAYKKTYDSTSVTVFVETNGVLYTSEALTSSFNFGVGEWTAYLRQRYADGNPVTIRYISATLQSETDFTAEQSACGDKYSAWRNGTEKVLGNDNAEYGAENTLTQNYIYTKEVS